MCRSVSSSKDLSLLEPCWYATISASPCTESIACAESSPAASLAFDPSRSTLFLIKKGLNPTTIKKGRSASVIQKLVALKMTTTTAGTRIDTKTGATVCAKKYSTSSTSCVAMPIKSPVLRRTRYAGASRSSFLKTLIRITESNLNAISWAIHDSSQ